MEKKELLEYFIDRDISELYGDFSDDGDGELELTDCGDEVAELIMEITDKAREEGRKELLDSIIEGVTQLKDLVSMFNPMSPEIRAKQSGEIEAYNGLLEKLSKLTTK